MKLIRIALLLFALIMAFALFSCNGKTNNGHKSFLYEENDDGTITIVGWTGLGSELTIPSKIKGKTVTVIAENAFRAVNGLVSVKIPSSVKVIDYAFPECESLKKVQLGSGIETMNGAFRGCISLESVTVGKKVVEMDEAFEGCVSLIKGYIPKTVTECDSSFKGCSSLKSVTIENGVKSLGYTFEGCTSLESVKIPDSVIEAVGTFEGCTSLESVGGGKNIEIFESTFKDCSSLETLALGENVKVMKEAFVNCSALSVIYDLPTTLEDYLPSFSGCSSITEIIIPEITGENDISKYDLMSDIAGCASLQRLNIRIPFSTNVDFCKTFAGLTSLTELNMPEENFATLIKVDSYYIDQFFEGENSEVKSALDYAKKTTYVRITDDYGYINSTSYTFVQGAYVADFDVEQIERETEVLEFEEFTKTAYWCGYPEGSNRAQATVAIERTYVFYLKTSGKNDGSLSPEIIINGILCSTEDMQG